MFPSTGSSPRQTIELNLLEDDLSNEQ